MLSLLFTIQLEGVLWGFGTALGELPPYFVARKARQLGKKHEDLEKLLNQSQPKNSPTTVKHQPETSTQIPQPNQPSFTDKIKQSVFNLVERHAFLTVTLMASIPNPLFDLAGLTCGHLLIPFWTFIAATTLGKAVFKVHLQMCFVIFSSSQPQIDYFLKILKSWNFNALSEFLQKAVDTQKKAFSGESEAGKSDSLVSVVWNVFITLMILYFVVSIVDSVAHEHFLNQKKRQKKIEKEKND